MSALLQLVRLDALTFEQLRVSEKIVRHGADPSVVRALGNARGAADEIRLRGHYYEAANLRRLINRIDDAAHLHRKLEPLHVAHKGILRAAWGEYARVLHAVERLAEEG